MYVLHIREVTDKQGIAHRLPAKAVALMYDLDVTECVIYGSPRYEALPDGTPLKALPPVCMGLVMRWRGIQEDLKAGIDTPDTRRLKALLQKGHANAG